MTRKIQNTSEELERILRFLFNKVPATVTQEQIIRAIGEVVFNQYRGYLEDKHIIERGEGTSYNIKAKYVIEEFNNLRRDKFNEQIVHFNSILAYGTVVLALGTIYPIASDILGNNKLNTLQIILIFFIVIITIILIINFLKVNKIYKS